MRRTIVFAVLTLLSAAVVCGETERQKKLAAAFPEIGKLFDAYVEREHIPGAAIGIIADGELVWTRTAGVQSIGGAPVTVDTAFRIASMTKSFTAAAILKLRDEKKLDLDDPVAKYVPELAKLSYPTSDSPVITVRHLLTHSAGFPEDNLWADRQMGQSNERVDAWLKAGLPFSTAPGTSFEYSNYGFVILGRIVERASGQPYDVYVRTKILEPLDMRSSTFHAAAVPAERKAMGYRWIDGKWIEQPILPHGGAFAAIGGLWTTTRDLARWVEFFLSAYPPRNEPERGPLKRSTAREMQESVRTWYSDARRAALDAPLRMRAAGYGYGLIASSNCRFRRIVWHNGGLPGYGSLMQWFPEQGVGFLFMGSRTYEAGGPLSVDVSNALWKTGALQPRPAVPSAALLAAQADATKLILQWNEQDAARVVSDNFFLDQTAESRKKEFAELVEKHGACTMGAIEAENALRGRWRLNCERGWIEVRATLAPTTPPRIQLLIAASVLPPGAELRERIEAALKPADASAFVPRFDPVRLRRQLAALEMYWGPCTLADPIRGDGKLRAALKLACENGSAVIDVELDGETKKIKNAAIVPDSEQTCVP
jgi:CubicO group peptidase (beta-lactamase class C family)